MPSPVTAYARLAFALILAGCASGASVIEIGDNAWRLAAIDYTPADATRIATDQVIAFCAKRGQVPYFAFSRVSNDMPGRFNATMEFQCTAGGSSPAAQAEALLRGYQRDCAIAGFPLGSQPNMNCALEISSKANARTGAAQ